MCSSDMDEQNLTGTLGFFLMGLPDDPEVQPIHFGLFLTM
jgi:hypothetical protein